MYSNTNSLAFMLTLTWFIAPILAITVIVIEILIWNHAGPIQAPELLSDRIERGHWKGKIENTPIKILLNGDKTSQIRQHSIKKFQFGYGSHF